MKRIIALLFLFIPLITFSQIGGEDEVYLNGDRVEAKFNGVVLKNLVSLLKDNSTILKLKNQEE